MASKIEWTEDTWNPVVGCTRVSEGCRNCYAERMSARLASMYDADVRRAGFGPGCVIHGPLADDRRRHYGLIVKREGDMPLPQWNNKVECVAEALDEPLRRRKPTTYFVNSMSDLLHADVPRSFIVQVFAVMRACPHHTFQVLTKRPERMAEITSDPDFMVEVEGAGQALAAVNGWCHAHEDAPWPCANVWLGTSVEDQAAADARIPHLLRCPAAVRFLSCEPLLGAVNLNSIEWHRDDGSDYFGALDRKRHPMDDVRLNGASIDWVIVGGESGPGARPMHPDCVRLIRDQCVAAGVPFFFKQWGTWVPYEHDAQPPFLTGQNGGFIDGHALPLGMTDRINECVDGWMCTDDMQVYQRVGKKASGRNLDGRAWNDMPIAMPMEVA